MKIHAPGWTPTPLPARAQKEHPLSADNAPLMTYGEFTKRRTAILSEITTLQRKLSDILNPAYTMMASNGPHIVEAQLANARERLVMLSAAWELQQRSQYKP